jgi:hypothetical protein
MPNPNNEILVINLSEALTRGKRSQDRFISQLTQDKEENRDAGRELDIQMHPNCRYFKFELRKKLFLHARQ